MKSSPALAKSAWISSLLALAAVPASATSYVMMNDGALADQAPVIAEVRVLSVDEHAGAGEPWTEYLMAVEDVVSGHVAASPLAVRVRGGLLPDGTGLEIYGAPRFEPGARALLFLNPRADGTYRVIHFMLGAFHLVELGGEQYAVRDLSDAVEVELPGWSKVRRGPRRLAEFRAWLADHARGVERPADYFVAEGALRDELEKFQLLRASSTGRPIRWRTFDTGGQVRWRAHQDGQPGIAGGGFGQFRTALAVWTNDPSTPIRYTYAGTTASRNGFSNNDGINAILFDDSGSSSEFDAPFSCFGGGGVLAVGGPWFTSGSSHEFNGTLFHEAGEADIITNEGLDCISGTAPWISQRKRAEEIFAHELGHTLGLGHSCDLDGQPSCNNPALNDAQMRAQVHGDGRGARLNNDDRAGIRFVYGSPLSAPEAPSGLSATAVAANRIDLAWSDNSTQETSFEIERRIGGGPYQRIAVRGANTTSYQDSTALSGTTHTYRVRAANAAGVSGYSNTATATTPGEAAPTGLTAAGVSASEIRLTWDDNATAEDAYEIEGKIEGGTFSLLLTVAADSTTATVGGLGEATVHTFRVRATGGAGNSSYSNQASATTFFADTEPCVPGPNVLCLGDGDRFQVEVEWRNFEDGTGSAKDVELPSVDSGLLWFFNENNWEMLIKVIDACESFDRFWVFAAATTNVEYTLTVTDTVTGFFKTYFNPLGEAAPAITDTDAFATCSAALPDGLRGPTAAPEAVAPAAAAAAGKQGSCVPSETTLCLNDHRFSVEIVWRDFEDETGSGRVDPFVSPDSGLQYFFNPQNIEMLVKLIDGCTFNGHFWVFAAATTNVEYTMTITDTEKDVEMEYFNPLGNAADAITDTLAFATCP